MTVLQTAGPISPSNPKIQEELDKKVSTTRTVNAKALSTDISLNNSDIGLGNVLNLEQKTHHGFFTNPSIPTFSGTTVTVAGASTSFTVFVNGVKSLISTNKTIDFSTTSSWDANVKANNYGQWFVFLKANLSLDASKAAWDILSLSAIPVCTVYLQDAGGSAYEGIVANEFHNYLRNLLEHKSQHDSWGAQYVSGFNSITMGGGVPTVNSFSLTGGTFRDEDIYHVVSNPQTQCRIAYRGTGGSALKFDAVGSTYAKQDGSNFPYYDNNGTITPVSNTNYGVYFLYATNHAVTPIISVMGQGEYNSVGLAQAAPQPSLPGVIAAEWKLLYRVIVQRTSQNAFAWIQSDPLFNVSTGPAINAEAISTISAGNVTYTPVSPDTSTNVQTALESVSTLKAPINAPTFTGIPAAPTAAADTNTTQLATTAFVVGQAGSSNPIMDGTVTVGTSLRYSRQDHVHPTDTSRAPTSHAVNANTYGYGDTTNAGHVRIGNGISITSGTISANYESSTSNIKMNGAVSVGALNTLARADHIHATDTTRVAANTAITAGTSTKITYDAKGLVTSGTSLSASDIPSLDAAKITTGTFDIARIPAAALERLVQVADQTARYALTTTEVQLGDTVKQLDTGIMYIVVDVANLGNAAGYVEYTAGSAASVPWSGVSSKPSTLSGYGITDAVPSSRTVNAKALSTNITLTTSDIADSTDKRYCTDAQKTVIGNTSGTNSGNVTLATNHGLSLTDQVIGMGTPSSITSSSTNSVTTTTHTHAIDSTIALIASPTFTGEPKAPTPIANSNSTLIATTAFVIGQAGNDNPLMNGAVSPGTGLKFARVDHCHASDTSRAASSHAHGSLTSSGGIGASANLPIITGTAGLLKTGTFGTAANTFCQGNDSRLSDSRTPTSHSLTSSHTVSGLTTGHFLKATGASSFGFAAHGLSAADVGAAPTSHAANAATYGYGDATNAGHLRVGNGLSVTTGTVSINYEATTTNIKMNGAVSVGDLNTIARADHIHPVDTSRAAVAGSSSQDFATNNLTVAKKFVPGVGTVAAGPTITIPNDYTIVVITDDSASAANLVTMPTGTNGQFLVIHNSDAQATTGQAIIPAGSTQMFIYVLSAWKPINAVVG